MLGLSQPSVAAAQGGTGAGVVIRNVADAEYVAGEQSLATRSNEAATTIDERLDVALAARPDIAAADPAHVPFLLINRGNGREAFVLSVPVVPAGRRFVAIARDADGDGRPDEGGIVDGGATAPIAAGGTAAFVVILSANAGSDATADGNVTIEARTATGADAPGTVFAGAGDGGADAVVGQTGGSASLIQPVLTAAVVEGSIEKSQIVRAPDGSARGVPGAVVTYTLRARVGVGATAARVDDPVPAGTRYVPGSLRLDDVAISDADDGDPGGCDGTRVTVALPTAGGARTISFQVIIQ
ncbi:hypothetical protein ACFSGX_09310 [Sphingomonas arantia]|uniref:DUF11 domain-containing protein n=1 Tax=Sphingomonas arantia TaxID=1460676 RepID=A0ABW4TZG6_9SPHN